MEGGGVGGAVAWLGCACALPACRSHHGPMQRFVSVAWFMVALLFGGAFGMIRFVVVDSILDG